MGKSFVETLVKHNELEIFKGLVIGHVEGNALLGFPQIRAKAIFFIADDL